MFDGRRKFKICVAPSRKRSGMEIIMKKYCSISILGRSWKMVSPYRLFICLGILLSFIIILLSTVSSYTLRVLVDDILPNRKMEFLWPIQFVFIGAVLIENLLSILRKRLFSSASQKSQADLRGKMFEKYLNADYLKKNKVAEAELSAAINYQVDALSGILENGIPVMLSNMIDVGITFAVMIYLDWKLTLLSIPVFPVLFLLSRAVGRKVGKAQNDYQVTRKNMLTDISDAFNCEMNIYNYGLFGYLSERFSRNTNNLCQKSVRMNVLYEIMNRMSWALIIVPYQAILYGIGGTWLIRNGMPTIGTMLIFANFTNHLIQPVMSLTNINAEIGTAKSIFGMLDRFEERLPEKLTARCVEMTNAAAEAVNLEYTYPNQESPCLKGVNCRFERNKLSVLWGPSGSGKSTLLKLLYELLLPEKQGCLIRNTNLRWGYFPQDPHMFSLTLLEHFRLIRKDITEKEVWSLLAGLSVEETVRQRGEGLLCKMSYSEGAFSLGEYRRLCLAVFCCADFDVMLLDEPTASLDEENTQAIVRMLQMQKEKLGKTVIISSHDRCVLDIADSVVKFGD